MNIHATTSPPPLQHHQLHPLSWKCGFFTQHNCWAASDSGAVMKSNDSLVQQGWPFHKGGDMWGRSPWLNGTPLSDCQSSNCHRVAFPSSRGKYYASTPGWINLPRLVCVAAWTASRFVPQKKMSSYLKCMNFNGQLWICTRQPGCLEDLVSNHL